MSEPATKRAKTEATPITPTAEVKKAFVAAHPALVEEIISELRPAYEMPDEAIAWFRRVLEYNCLGGKMNRGLSVITSLELLRQSDSCEGSLPLAAGELREAQILGWCVEWLQAYFLVADDIMDDSKTRRGQPCWYRVNGVGNIAVNDSFLIESAIYKLLKAHFRQKPYYVDLLELMHEITYKTELGQMLDLITAPEDKPEAMQNFSMTKYKAIVKYKTAFYSFYLPVAMAMMMAGVTEKKEYDAALTILLEMGEFFQIQDDYLDCYGDPEVIGKIGTDIEDNKCGWLINQALMICTPEQRKILDDNYARKDPACVDKIKGVFKELELERLYKEHEEASYAKLERLIAETECTMPKEIFYAFAKKIYKRTK